MSDDVVVHTQATRRGLSLLAAGVRQAATLALRAAVAAAEASAKATTLWKDRSTVTRSEIKGRVVTADTGILVAGGASRFLENGTKPHLIVAHGRALRFVVNGAVMFRKWVNHPGTAPRPFLAEARERGQVTAEYGAEYYVNEAIARVR